MITRYCRLCKWEHWVVYRTVDNDRELHMVMFCPKQQKRVNVEREEGLDLPIIESSKSKRKEAKKKEISLF